MSTMNKYDFLFKIIIIGDSGVGKTNIMSRFVSNSFSNDTKITLGVDFVIKDIQIDKQKIKLQIWDTAGQERFRAVTNVYYKDTSGVLLVYDITNYSSFHNCQKWYSEIKKYMETNTPIILIGNKNDLLRSRSVLSEEAQDYANIHKMAFYETSALDNSNIEQIFRIMGEKMYNNKLSTISNSHITKNMAFNINFLKDSNGSQRNCCQ